MGLRGVGKTVRLNEVPSMAEEEGALTDFIEVANNEPLSIDEGESGNADAQARHRDFQRVYGNSA